MLKLMLFDQCAETSRQKWLDPENSLKAEGKNTV